MESTTDGELREEEGREDSAFALRVGLHTSVDAHLLRGQANDVQRDSGECSDEQEDIDASGSPAAHILERPAVAMTLQVSERLLDLHALAINIDDGE